MSISTLNLMIAGPELLDACRALLKEVIAERDCLYECHAHPDTGEVTDDEGKQGIAELDAIIDQAQAAIAKATGEQQ